jgi:hypothetical protein
MPSNALAIQVERRIYLIRGEKVMLDYDLARRNEDLESSVRRNIARFPHAFMLQVSDMRSNQCRL